LDGQHFSTEKVNGLRGLAEDLHRLSESQRDGRVRRKLLWLAAECYRGAAEYGDSVRLTAEYLRQYAAAYGTTRALDVATGTGEHWCDQRRFEDAIDLYRAAVSAGFPDSKDAIGRLMLEMGIAHEHLNCWESAASIYERAIEKHASSLDPKFCLRLMNCYQHLLRKENAVQLLQRMRESYPDAKEVPAAHYYLAGIYYKLQDRAAARLEIETILEKHPDSIEAEWAQSLLQAMEKGRDSH
jgi:tetratricopeptide (TPR) repeat protein